MIKSGRFLRSVNLGDGIADVQATPDGEIWVSYFDEGVFGDGIGRYGAICFDAHGDLRFNYGEYAKHEGLPLISDCYAMNVSASGDVWLNYYTDFPLVHLRNFVLEHVWQGFGKMGGGFAVRNEKVVYLQEGQLRSKPLESPENPEMLQAKDESGASFVQLPKRRLEYAFRGPHLALNIGPAVYASV
jgi:hypothetical protein